MITTPPMSATRIQLIEQGARVLGHQGNQWALDNITTGTLSEWADHIEALAIEADWTVGMARAQMHDYVLMRVCDTGL